MIIETFGCQMNVADSEMLEELLFARGFEHCKSDKDADLIVVNTCSVRAKAENRAKARLREYAAHKKKGAQLWVVGCMAENIGDELKKEIPKLDRVIGAPDMEYLSFNIDGYLKTLSTEDANEASHTSGISRFLPIMRGCDNYCSYCIVPFVRGREHSVKSGNIYKQILEMAETGTKEITLLGQNVNSYNDNGMNLTELIHYLHDIPKIERIRFTTSHPKDMSDDLIQTVKELPKLATHIHLPVQSGSTEVLKRMNRKYTIDHYMTRIDLIKKLLPNADITTDVMVGFPGESDAEFEETLNLFKKVNYTTAYMFGYSVRKGTAAEKYENQIPLDIIKARLQTLVDLQNEITKKRYFEMIGTEGEALFTRRQTKGKREWVGQDYGFKRVVLEDNEDLYGKIIRYRVASATGRTLIAERI